MPIDLRRTIESRRWLTQVNLVASHALTPERARIGLLRRAGITLGPNPRVQSGCWFFGADVRFGRQAWVNHRVYFDSRLPIWIGDNVGLATESMICTSMHLIGPSAQRWSYFDGAPVRIEDGCWIGQRATVLPGVTVGRGCLVAAGAMVTKDCAPDGLYAGVPARRVRDLDQVAA